MDAYFPTLLAVPTIPDNLEVCTFWGKHSHMTVFNFSAAFEDCSIQLFWKLFRQTLCISFPFSQYQFKSNYSMFTYGSDVRKCNISAKLRWLVNMRWDEKLCMHVSVRFSITCAKIMNITSSFFQVTDYQRIFLRYCGHLHKSMKSIKCRISHNSAIKTVQ